MAVVAAVAAALPLPLGVFTYISVAVKVRQEPLILPPALVVTEKGNKTETNKYDNGFMEGVGYILEEHFVTL